MNEYCRTRAAPDGSNFYYACLYQSAATRPGLYALFALYYELIDGVLSASDPGVSRIKLAWWREELGRLQEGRPRHPVGEALQELVKRDAIDLAPLVRLPGSIESLFSLSATGEGEGWHAAGNIGEFWRCAAEFTGPVGAEQSELIGAAGAGVTRLEILQNLRHLLNLGFNPLPEDVWEEAGLTRDALMSDPASGAARYLAGSLTTTLRDELDRNYRRIRSRADARLLFVLIMNRLAAATCHEIHRDGDRLLSHKVALTPIRKLMIAVRTRYARLLPLPGP